VRFTFGDYVLDAQQRELRRRDQPVPLEPQVFDLLLYLVTQRHRVVSKDELLAHVWGGRVVSDTALATRLNAVRKAVGDSGAAQSVIRTAARKGFRFVADVIEPAVPLDAGELAPVAAIKPSIAVVPFENVGNDAAKELFGDGIADDVTAALARYRSLLVIARTSAFTFKGKNAGVTQIGRALGARYILEGSVRCSDNLVRVTAQLIDAESGVHLWAERFDRPLTDILSLQDEITAQVVAVVVPTVARTEREQAARKSPDNLGAWENYHRGLWHCFKLEAAENRQAQIFLRRSSELDPGFAAPLAALSLTCMFDALIFQGNDREPHVDNTLRYGRKAVELDPLDATGHMGYALGLLMSGRHDQAMTEANLAASLNPNDAWAAGIVGCVHMFSGRPSAAYAPLALAMRLSPFDPLTWCWQHWLSRAQYNAGDYEAAVATSRMLCDARGVRPGYHTLIASLGQLSRRAEAQTVIEEGRAKVPDLGAFAHARELLPEHIAHLHEGLAKSGFYE
jgi:TolB-like protein